MRARQLDLSIALNSSQNGSRIAGVAAVRPLFITPGSPWENGYIESFNGKFRDELLSGDLLFLDGGTGND
jgi:hypothetical protein